MNNNILGTAVTILSVISAYAPVHLLNVLYNDEMNEAMSYRSMFNRAEYTFDRAVKTLDSANAKAREAEALVDGSIDMTSLAWKYTEDIHRSVV